MTVDQVTVGRDASVAPELGIEVADELMTEHVEVGPVGRAAALGAADNLRVEASCLLEVANLDGHMKWRKSHGSPPVRYRNATGSRGYQMRPCAAGASLRRRQAVHPCTAVARPCAGAGTRRRRRDASRSEGTRLKSSH